MTRPKMPDQYPPKRLIVFAGVNSQVVRSEALRDCNAEAVMLTFADLGKGTWWAKKVRPVLNEYPQYRYLDSGVFTLMRRAGATYYSTKSQPNAAKDKATDNTKTPELSLKELKDHVARYAAFLEANLDDFDFVIEMDVDKFKIIREDGRSVPGLEVADHLRERLARIVGDKLLPVWHVEGDSPKRERWQNMIRNFKYVCISGDPKIREKRYMVDEAHEHGCLVHQLGSSKRDVLETTTFDTFDSTTWISSVKFGGFGEFIFRRDAPMEQREISKARAFREKVIAWGYDPDVLIAPGTGQKAKYEVAIKVFQERQEDANGSITNLGMSRLPID